MVMGVVGFLSHHFLHATCKLEEALPHLRCKVCIAKRWYQPTRGSLACSWSESLGTAPTRSCSTVTGHGTRSTNGCRSSGRIRGVRGVGYSAARSTPVYFCGKPSIGRPRAS